MTRTLEIELMNRVQHTTIDVEIPAQERFNNLTNETELVRPAYRVRASCEICLDAILQDLARRAARSKGKRAKALGGWIKVKILR